MIPYFFLLFTIVAVIFSLSLGLNIDPTYNFIWLLLLSVFNCLLGGMSLGTILGVMLPDMETANLALPLVGLPLVMLSGAFVSIRSLLWPLFLLSYLSPVRFVY